MIKRWIKRALLWSLLLVLAYVVSAVIYLVVFLDGPRKDSPFELAHERAIQSFVDGEGFGVIRMRSLKHWNDLSVTIDGESYQVRRINLIGATPEDGPRYFTGLRPPSKRMIEDAENRELSVEELEALAVLGLREKQYVMESVEEGARLMDEDTRVIAPMFARRTCMKCHEAKKGELLGAFDYRLLKRK